MMSQTAFGCGLLGCSWIAVFVVFVVFALSVCVGPWDIGPQFRYMYMWPNGGISPARDRVAASPAVSLFMPDTKASPWQPLPSSFTASALPTRKQYEASLKLTDEDRMALEAAAYLDLATSGSLDSSPASVLDVGPSMSGMNEATASAMQDLWSGESRCRKSKGRTRAFHITSGTTGGRSREAIAADLAAAFGPVVHSTTSEPEIPGSPEAPCSPSFRTKQLAAILENLRAGSDCDEYGDKDTPPDAAPMRHRRRGGASSAATMSVLSRAGAL